MIGASQGLVRKGGTSEKGSLCRGQKSYLKRAFYHPQCRINERGRKKHKKKVDGQSEEISLTREKQK